jgi:hypothetical protein
MSEETIAAIGQLLGERTDRTELAAACAALRIRQPDLVLLRCDAADVLEEPFRSYPAVDLHLVDTRNHCTAMTSDPASATGVLVAVKAAS